MSGEKHKSKELLELENSLAEQHELYLKHNSEHVYSDTNLRQEEWITNSTLSSEKFSKDIFESLYKDQNKKLVFELLKNPYFPQEYLLELADVQESYSNEELYLLWLILKHPNCPESVLNEVSELMDSYEISLLKKSIALNPNAKKSVVQDLLKNDYRWVRQAAASHLRIERKDILELIKLAETGITELQKENQDGDRYTLKGFLENKNLDENLKQTISNLLEDEGTYPKQYTTYEIDQPDQHGRIGGGEIPLEPLALILIDCSDAYDIGNALIDINEEWTYTNFFDVMGCLNGGGVVTIKDASLSKNNEEFYIDFFSTGDFDDSAIELGNPEIDIETLNLEVGTFFYSIISYDDGMGEFESIYQEDEINIWECLDHYDFGIYKDNSIWDFSNLYPINELGYDRKSTLYVKTSKNSYEEVSLEDLSSEVRKKFGDELSEDKVIKYLKNKYK